MTIRAHNKCNNCTRLRAAKNFAVVIKLIKVFKNGVEHLCSTPDYVLIYTTKTFKLTSRVKWERYALTENLDPQDQEKILLKAEYC